MITTNFTETKLNFEIGKISKKSASKSIDYILKGGKSVEKIESIASNSY